MEDKETDVVLKQIIEQLNKWIETCERDNKFQEMGLTLLDLQFKATAQAYWNVKEFIDVNYLNK